MPKLPTWAWIAIALLAAYLAWRVLGSSRARSWGPIKVTYNKIGNGIDALGNPFNWTNPGR
jgi:hypothetical protein